MIPTVAQWWGGYCNHGNGMSELIYSLFLFVRKGLKILRYLITMTNE